MIVAGARPNFIKIAPLIDALRKESGVQVSLVNTGQHYDYLMCTAFFEDLAIPEPDIFLGIGSGHHGEQTGRILTAFEEVLLQKEDIDVIVVVGDVNSTLACTLAAAKCKIPVAHVEAGLRSFDRTMPEEVNRIVTDGLSDYLFTPSEDADENLKREGIPQERIFRVGNVMIDTLRRYEPVARLRAIPARFGLQPQNYTLCTLHRPSNVDEPETLLKLLQVLETLQQESEIVFPLHPRTRSRMIEYGLENHLSKQGGIRYIEPLGYLDFLGLVASASLILTDSGGIQEETTVLGIPCLTLRECTERPVTVHLGTNSVIGTDPENILRSARQALRGDWQQGSIPEGWDGHAAERIARVLTRERLSLAPRKFQTTSV
jgi:UDP-N-acetylglucosamine 2-epimerase (non-hydrolysing)